MILLAALLATFWAWEFIYAYVTLPDYVSQLLVPLLAAGMLLLPSVILFPLAIAALVGLLHRFFVMARAANTTAKVKPKRSNIPPPP